MDNGTCSGSVSGIAISRRHYRAYQRAKQLKDVFDYAKRTEILSGAFAVDTAKTAGKRLLLIDDLYPSGATVSTITTLLTSTGEASAVYLITLTQTRKLA